jgi:Cu/Ag efflux protein CusF
MKNIIKSGLFCVLLAGTAAVAAEHQPMMTMEAGQQWTDGVVKKIDKADNKITIKHAAMAGVMPAMTMSYHVMQPDLLKSRQAGDKVRFVVEKNVVTRIEAVK